MARKVRSVGSCLFWGFFLKLSFSLEFLEDKFISLLGVGSVVRRVGELVRGFRSWLLSFFISSVL